MSLLSFTGKISHLPLKPWLPWLIIGLLMLTLVSTGCWYGYQQYQSLHQQTIAFQQQSSDLN